MHTIPALIKQSEIKVDLQVHSKWSDACETIVMIANYILTTFPQYGYIALIHQPCAVSQHGFSRGCSQKKMVYSERCAQFLYTKRDRGL